MSSFRNLFKFLFSGIRPTLVKPESTNPSAVQHSALQPPTVIFPVVGKIYFSTAAQFGQLTTPSAQRMDERLRQALESPLHRWPFGQSVAGPMSQLDTIQKDQGIDSIKWQTLLHAFDDCPCLRRSEDHDEKEFRLSAKEYFAKFRARAKDRAATIREDVMMQLQKFVDDDDVLANTSSGLQEVVGLLVRPIGTEAPMGGGMESREHTFMDINILRYVNLGRPCIKISRLFLVVSIEFKHTRQPQADWNIIGAYNSCTYLVRKDWLESHFHDVREQGHQEIQNAFSPRKNSRLS